MSFAVRIKDWRGAPCPWQGWPGRGHAAVCSAPDTAWPLAEAKAYVDEHGGEVFLVRGAVKTLIYKQPLDPP